MFIPSEPSSLDKERKNALQKYFKKILFCTDFNTDAMKAFHYTLNIAEGNPAARSSCFM